MPKSRKTRPSSTPGKVKDKNCQKTEAKNRYCLDTRFYKNDPLNYMKVCEQINDMKGNQKSGWIDEAKKEMKS